MLSPQMCIPFRIKSLEKLLQMVYQNSCLEPNKLEEEDKKTLEAARKNFEELQAKRKELERISREKEELENQLKSKIENLKHLVDAAKYYEDNKEEIDSKFEEERLLLEYLAEVENFTSEDSVGTCNQPKGQKKSRHGKLKRMLAKYISTNPEFMKEYKKLLDGSFSWTFENGIFVITSTFTKLRPETSNKITLDEVKRQIRILKTNHLNNQFCKDKERLQFDEMTTEYLNTKFK